MGNPAVFFDETTSPQLDILDLNSHVAVVEESYFVQNGPEDLVVDVPLNDNLCSALPGYTDDGTFIAIVGEFNNEYYLYDPRFRVFDNSLDDPKLNGGGDLVKTTKREDDDGDDYYKQVQCFNAPRTFLNENDCVLSFDEDACTFQEQDDDASIAGAKVMCGSPFEVASDPTNGGEIRMGAFSSPTVNEFTEGENVQDQRAMIWMEIAMKGQDNLRQRVAWTLSQILAISPDSINADVFTEAWVVRVLSFAEQIP